MVDSDKNVNRLAYRKKSRKRSRRMRHWLRERVRLNKLEWKRFLSGGIKDNEK